MERGWLSQRLQGLEKKLSCGAERDLIHKLVSSHDQRQTAFCNILGRRRSRPTWPSKVPGCVLLDKGDQSMQGQLWLLANVHSWMSKAGSALGRPVHERVSVSELVVASSASISPTRATAFSPVKEGEGHTALRKAEKIRCDNHIKCQCSLAGLQESTLPPPGFTLFWVDILLVGNIYRMESFSWNNNSLKKPQKTGVHPSHSGKDQWEWRCHCRCRYTGRVFCSLPQPPHSQFTHAF